MRLVTSSANMTLGTITAIRRTLKSCLYLCAPPCGALFQLTDLFAPTIPPLVVSPIKKPSKALIPTGDSYGRTSEPHEQRFNGTNLTATLEVG
jgi:hypothetical protein